MTPRHLQPGRPRPSRLWSALEASLRARPRDVAGLALWALVEALPAFASGRLVALATDRGFLAHRPRVGFAWLVLLGVAVLVGALANRQVCRRLAAIVEPFRDDLVHLAVAGALARSTVAGAAGDAAAVARLTRHVEIAREAYAGVLIVTQGFVVNTVGALLGLLSLEPRLLLLVVVPLMVGLGLFLGAFGRLALRQRASILADERIAAAGSGLATGLRDTVACGAEDIVAARVQTEIDAQADATRDLARFTALRTLALGIGGRLPLLLILAAGPALVHRGATPGAILGALTYVMEGVHPALSRLVRGLGNVGLWLFVALGRVLEEARPLPAPVPNAVQGGPVHPEGCGVSLGDVSFRYGRWAEPIVDGLDLDIAEGDHLVVVGPSGVGKSTLAGIISGLLYPQAGAVRLGGADVGRLDPVTLARHRVLIPQEAYVFAGTVRENLCYLSNGLGTGRLESTVELLGMEDLVRRLGGFDAEVDPSSLSAGERQLVTLARAYLSPAELVILDEATCHLDPVAEARAELAFARRPGTLVVIAHRISSALRAERVLVMDGNRVVVGTHEELKARSPLYRDLVGHWLVRS